MVDVDFAQNFVVDCKLTSTPPLAPREKSKISKGFGTLLYFYSTFGLFKKLEFPCAGKHKHYAQSSPQFGE